MDLFHVDLKKTVDHSYDIVIGSGLEDRLQEDLDVLARSDGRSIAVITDSNVYAHYGAELESRLKSALPELKINTAVFPAGEKSKTRETKAYLEDLLISWGYRRDTGPLQEASRL